MNKALFFLVLTCVLSFELVGTQEEIIHDMNKELAMENDSAWFQNLGTNFE